MPDDLVALYRIAHERFAEIGALDVVDGAPLLLDTRVLSRLRAVSP